MYPPGSGYAPNIIGLTTSCQAAGGLASFSVNKQISESTCTVQLTNDLSPDTLVWQDSIEGTTNVLNAAVGGLADGAYTLLADNGENSRSVAVVVSCGGTGGGAANPLTLRIAHTDETATEQGTITLTGNGGEDPLYLEVVELSLGHPTTAGTPEVFTGIPSGTYRVRAADGGSPTQIVTGTVTIEPYAATVTGCRDEYASNYDPAATVSGSCDYAPLWRSAWGPRQVPVRVAAVGGQQKAYIAAELRIGFRPGHPLAEQRPLGAPTKLRATVGPDGYATFRLGPFLQAALGVPDGAGGYRLDINTATEDDFLVGYELRRADDQQLLEHGYAINSAVPDAELAEGTVLSAFEQVPVWPGYGWNRLALSSRSAGAYGAIDKVYPSAITLPCPSNPLPVAWLSPRGGWDFWVFQGRPTVGDATTEGQGFNEPDSDESRLSDAGQTRRTVKATSGVFRHEDLLEGLRTLWASPQAWYQPQLDGPWVAILLERGSRDVARLGVGRKELSISFTEAAPRYVQGQ